MLKILEVSCVLLLIRAIYRIVEYAQGFDGYLMQHEVFFFVFDSLMMLLTQLCYNVVYPGKILIHKQENPAQRIEIQVCPIEKTEEPKQNEHEFGNQDLIMDARQ